ncbi:MAG: hypothetical protein GY928_14420, partial [Colwellia sp.]|nr:hypothetical protein [Colwellia sp.]
VATRNGIEAVIRAVANLVDTNYDDPDFTVLKIDLRNAFNEVDRQSFINALRDEPLLHGICRWSEYCYKSPSQLILNQAIIQSTTGVQ